jgi:putative hydrolase of the HAD superfamily
VIKVIIFDFFDVFRTDGFNRWLHKYGYSHEGKFLEITQVHDRGGYSEREFFQALADAAGQTYEQVERELESGNELNTELVEYANELKKSYKIALLSNSASKYLRDELKKYDIEKLFDLILISSEVGLIKPEPEIFRYIMGQLAVDAEECVFIDDNMRHVNAAASIGIKSIQYTSVADLKEQLKKVL